MEKAPIRVHRKRTKGSKLPKNTVCVGRGSKWGNPFCVIGRGATWFIFQAIGRNEAHDNIAKTLNPINAIFATKCEALHFSMEMYNEYLEKTGLKQIAKTELKDKNVACWCKLTEKCHADILLKTANEL